MSATDRQHRIAELTTELLAEAEQRKEIAEKQGEVLKEFGVATATLDQRIAEVKDRAKLVAAYFCELKANGVEVDEAGWLARDEAGAMREEEAG